MNNKTIAQLLKSAVKNSNKRESMYYYSKILGCEELLGVRTVVDGDKLKSKIETIIEMLESVEGNEG